MISLRVESEAIRKRAIEFEVKQLRCRISDYHVKISTMTKGVHVSKTILMEIEEHKKRFKDLCDRHNITIEAVKNDLPEHVHPLKRTEIAILRALNLYPFLPKIENKS